MIVEDHSADRETELEPSQIHNVLRNDRRRRTIKHVKRAEKPVSVDTLAEHIASLETDESPPPRDVRKSVYVSLHQTHLPKLDELDIIEYDQRDQQIELQDRVREVEVYMEVIPENGVPWPTYYLGVSVLGVGTLLGARFGLPLVSSFGVAFWAWYFLPLFGVSALYHAYLERKRERSGD